MNQSNLLFLYTCLDPEPYSEFGSGSTKLLNMHPIWIRIQKTFFSKWYRYLYFSILKNNIDRGRYPVTQKFICTFLFSQSPPPFPQLSEGGGGVGRRRSGGQGSEASCRSLVNFSWICRNICEEFVRNLIKFLFVYFFTPWIRILFRIELKADLDLNNARGYETLLISKN